MQSRVIISVGIKYDTEFEQVNLRLCKTPGCCRSCRSSAGVSGAAAVEPRMRAEAAAAVWEGFFDIELNLKP